MADIDRRALLAATAACGSELLPYARPSQAAETAGPIERAHPELVRLLNAWDAACEAEWEAEELYEPLPRPLWHPATSQGGYEWVRVNGKERPCVSFSPENIALLREIANSTFDPDRGDSPSGYRTRMQSAQATLDCISAWQAEDLRRREAAGLTAATAVCERAREAVVAHLAVIDATPASTYRELAFQAAYLHEDFDEARATSIITRLLDLAGIAPREFAA